MRKLVLLAAAVPLLFAPTALATDGADAEPSCPPPEITPAYDTERLAVHVKLRATDCPPREHRQFMLAAHISRFDGDLPTDGSGRSVLCGPFPTRAGLGQNDSESYFFCEVEAALDHPTVETARYVIDATYPGEDSDRTTTLILSCHSDGESAVCEN